MAKNQLTLCKEMSASRRKCISALQTLLLGGLIVVAGTSNAQRSSEDCQTLKILVEENFNGFSPTRAFSGPIAATVFGSCKIRNPELLGRYPYAKCDVLWQTEPSKPFIQTNELRDRQFKLASAIANDISTCLSVPLNAPEKLPAGTKVDGLTWGFDFQAAHRSRETGLVPSARLRVELHRAFEGELIKSASGLPIISIYLGRSDRAYRLSSTPPPPQRSSAKDFRALLGLNENTTATQVVKRFGPPTTTIDTSIYYEDDEDDTVFAVSFDKKTEKISRIRIIGREGVLWLHQRGAEDAKLNFIGRHRDDITAAFGVPVEEKGSKLFYANKEVGVELNFFLQQKEWL